MPRIIGGCIGAYAAKHIKVGSCSLVSAWHLASISVCASQRSRAEHPGGLLPVVLKEARLAFAFSMSAVDFVRRKGLKIDWMRDSRPMKEPWSYRSSDKLNA